MYRYVVLLLTVCFCAGALADTESVVPRPDGRIVGGKDTNIEVYPHQISLRYNSNHRCGGSIIENDIILTAAHCVNTLSSAAGLTVVAGNTYLSDKAQAIPVLKFIVHEGYNSANSVNDVAILVLQGRLTYSASVQPIRLADARPADGSTAQCSGWGALTEGGRGPDRLQVVELDIISNSVCKSKYVVYTIDESMICAMVEGGGKDACQGDSGGPLIQNGRQVGVVSWGIGCARKSFPGVYASVAKLNPWIVEKTRANTAGLA